MTKSLHIALKPGERLYVNGAVLRFNRKVAVEFLNDVTFLLESHVLQPEQTTTPLQQLYFAAQTMLIEPVKRDAARRIFDQSADLLARSLCNAELLGGLREAKALVDEGRVFDAMKLIRALYPIEQTILNGGTTAPASAHEKEHGNGRFGTFTGNAVNG